MADQEGAQGLKGLELGGEIICKDDFSRLKKRHLLIVAEPTLELGIELKSWS